MGELKDNNSFFPTPEDLKRWEWERHGEGYALYQGRTGLTHGMNRLWVSDKEFDSSGPQLRKRIQDLLNKDEGLDVEES